MTALPPRRFRPAGAVSSVRHSVNPPAFVKPKRRRGARRKGEIYESRVSDSLEERFGDQYIRSPWFRFHQRDAVRERWCQIDGMIVFPDLFQVVIVEVKLHHTAQAWWQVERLYRPVLEDFFLPGAWELISLEIVRFFDPQTPFPERPAMIPDISVIEPGRFNVHIWNPARGLAL